MRNQKNNKLPNCINSMEIIAVGTELLMGHTVNTNAAYLAEQLSEVGIPSFYQSTVGDNHERLRTAICQALARSDGAIMTGGLGPTRDDITTQVASDVLELELICHEESKDRIKRFFRNRNIPMAESNFKQAMLPEGAIVMPNDVGTAPGIILESNGKVLILLPGPPSEMRLMFEKYTKKYLQEHAPFEIHSTFVRIFGIGESAAEDRIRDLIDQQTNPTIAPYCSTGECMFRISYSQPRKNESDRKEEETHLIESTVKEISARLGEYIYEIGERNLPRVVFDLLNEKKRTLAFAESCTAGWLSSMVGDIPGASAVLVGSVIPYSNHAKITLLGISPQLLEEHGAISEEVAIAMAVQCRALFSSDLAVAITGIAGPGGGSEEKPVGLVYIALTAANNTIVKRFTLSGDRNKIRYLTSLNALDLIRKEVLRET